MVAFVPTMKPLGGEAAARAEAAQPVEKAEAKPAEKIDFSNVKIEPLFEEMVDFETFSKSDFRAVKIEACEAVPKEQEAAEVRPERRNGAQTHDPERHP